MKQSCHHSSDFGANVWQTFSSRKLSRIVCCDDITCITFSLSHFQEVWMNWISTKVLCHARANMLPYCSLTHLPTRSSVKALFILDILTSQLWFSLQMFCKSSVKGNSSKLTLCQIVMSKFALHSQEVWSPLYSGGISTQVLCHSSANFLPMVWSNCMFWFFFRFWTIVLVLFLSFVLFVAICWLLVTSNLACGLPN